MESWGTFGQLVILLRMVDTKQGQWDEGGLSLAGQRGGGERNYHDILGLVLPHCTEWWQSAFHSDLRMQNNYTFDCSN